MQQRSGLHVTGVPLKDRVNMLSVDVECWHRIIYRNLTGESMTPCSKCHEMTHSVLSLLREQGVTATFFVLGDVAETFPDLVRSMDADGHEVASHGYSHTPLGRLTPVEFREEIRTSIELLTRILGKPVLGFRAPEFSLVERSFWALDILAELGVKYDSSIFPFAGSRYGVADFPREVVRVQTGNGSILEVPPSTVRVFGRNLPVAGGGYFRLMPYSVIRRAVRRVTRAGLPFVLYVHPYELSLTPLRCDDFPSRVDRRLCIKTEAKWNVFRSTMRTKLKRLLTEFRFASIREVLGNVLHG